jgi:hypothetical protein
LPFRLAVGLALAALVAGMPSSSVAARSSVPIHFGAALSLDGARDLAAVSCLRADSCVALDSRGRAYHFNGSHWGAPRRLVTGAVGPGAIAVACAGRSLCVAEPTGASDVVVGTGASWSAPTQLEGAVGLESLGCSRSGYCAAVDAEGNSWAFSRGSWQRTSGDWGAVASIACVSPSFCVSAGPTGLSSWDGSRWSSPAPLGASSAFSGVSCASASFCVAVDEGGQALRWNGSHWSTPLRIEPSARSATSLGPYPTAISCPTATLCVAVDDVGSVLELRSGAWSRTSTGSSHVFSSVSCPEASFCAAADRRGQVLIGRS